MTGRGFPRPDAQTRISGKMSQHSRNWLKFIVLVTLAFVLGLFFAGLLNFPRPSLAQNSGTQQFTPIAQVDPPRIPSARPLADLSEAFAAVSEAVRPSVVYIDARQTATSNRRQQQGLPLFDDRPQRPGVLRSTGTGFIVSADGYILTNQHVIKDASNITVQLLDGRVVPAQIVGSSASTDIGVLKIEAEGLKPASLGNSSATRVGEWVLAIGNPLGGSLTFTVTQGIISAKGRGLPEAALKMGIVDFLQTDAAINQGNSGGPLVNVRGEVIGMNSVIASQNGMFQGYAFAIPIDLAKAVMSQLITNGKVERTGLDVSVREVTADDAAYLELDSIAGVKVDDFGTEDSPARKAGLLPGDVIVSIDGMPVSYVAQLQQLVGFRHAGDPVKVTVARGPGGKRIEYEVRLAPVPLDSASTIPTPIRPADDELAKANRLGVAVEPLSSELARQLGMPASTKGLIVKDVALFSAASERLCPVGSRGCAADVILSVEGKPVRTESDFKTAVAGGHNGVVSLEIVTMIDGRPFTRIERVRTVDVSRN